MFKKLFSWYLIINKQNPYKYIEQLHQQNKQFMDDNTKLIEEIQKEKEDIDGLLKLVYDLEGELSRKNEEIAFLTTPSVLDPMNMVYNWMVGGNNNPKKKEKNDNNSNK
jgi:hypothetical protein